MSDTAGNNAINEVNGTFGGDRCKRGSSQEVRKTRLKNCVLICKTGGGGIRLGISAVYECSFLRAHVKLPPRSPSFQGSVKKMLTRALASSMQGSQMTTATADPALTPSPMSFSSYVYVRYVDGSVVIVVRVVYKRRVL